MSLAGSGNDILRGADVDVLASRFEHAVVTLQAAGLPQNYFTGFDPRMFPVIRLLRGRIATYDMHLRAIADHHGCDLVDLWSMRSLQDPRAWSPDRLHLSSEGHRRVAHRTCEVLGAHRSGHAAVDGAAANSAAGDGLAPLPASSRSYPAGRAVWLAARRQDARWARQYAMPWVRRRLAAPGSSQPGSQAPRPASGGPGRPHPVRPRPGSP